MPLSTDSSTAASIPTVGASRTRYRILALISGLSCLTYLDRICIARLQGDIQHDLNLSSLEMGFVFSAFVAGYSFALLPVGWLADRCGPRRVILVIVLAWSLFTALTGAVQNFWPDTPLWLPLPGGWTAVGWGLAAMVTVRFLFGCGEAGVYPTLAKIVRTWFPVSERGVAQGTIFMCARLGAALSPVLVGRLSDVVGWRWAFAMLGVAGVFWSLIFARAFCDKPSQHSRINDEELTLIGTPDASVTGVRQPLPWRTALSSPTVWAMLISYMSINIGWSFYPTWQPRFLLDVHELDYHQSELLIGLPFLCGAAGSFLGGRCSDLIFRRTGNLRLARRMVGVVGFTGAGVAFMVAAAARHPWEAVSMLSLAAFSNDLALGPFWAATSDIGGRFTGTLAGFFNSIGCLCVVFFLPLVPWMLAKGLTWPQLLAAMGCIWIVAALSWLLVDASQPLVPEDAEVAEAA